MITLDELMNERRSLLMSLMREKRCIGLQSTLAAALNAITAWQRSAARDDYAAFNSTYAEASSAIDDALELLLLPFDMAAAKQHPAGLPTWLQDVSKRGAA
jgi:hypothetical protein